MQTNKPTILVVIGALAAAAALGTACPATQAEPAAPIGPALPATTPVPAGPDPQGLYEGFTVAHPWRAVLANVGTWKLTRDEEWRQPIDGASSWVPFDVLVADQAGDEVRVVAEREDLLYAVWIPLADLARVPVQTVALAPAPGGPPDEDEPGVRLAGGAPLETLEQQDGWTHVRTTAAEVKADGWVPDVLLGRIYHDADFAVADETVDLEPAVGLEVRDAPDGRLLAFLRSDPSLVMRVRALGPAQNGWREIRYPTPVVVVHGWVQADGLATASAESPPGSTHTISTYHARGDFNWLQVPIATEVTAVPDGEVFAVTTAGTKLIVGAERSPNRTSITVRTIWGDAPGWVKCEPIPSGMSQPLIDTCVPPFEE
jgi:hypothetical protein